MTLLRVSSPLILVGLLSGCPRLPPLDYGKGGPARDAADLLKRIEVAEAQVVSVKGDARLVVDAERGKGAVALFVAVLHPARLHLEQLDFFGRPEGVLVTDGDQFGLYDGKQRKYFRGPATAQNLARFLPIALPPRELAALLLGRVPRLPAETTTMSVDEATRRYRLTLTRGAVTQHLEVAPGSHRVTSSRVEGLDTYAVAASELTDFGAATLPRHLVLDVPRARLSVELVYKDVVVNEPPELTLFELEPPEGVPVVEVQADGQVVPAAP
ncbi:MAG: DUF4292 domain-containing protein [Myxococcaceae bacterium]|jgi:hypothetical protein|nr:DUF4292 domain-containing protein [Myxococcaceae bacterium]MCA3014074.1 DUF4292 domain-containing protein [Myxococcaceae bacterium]